MYTPNTPYDLQNRMFYATIGVYYGNGTYRWDKSYLAGFTLTENLSNGNALAMGTINSSRIEVEFVQLTNEYAKRLYKGVQIKPRLTACTQMSTYPTIVTTLPSTMDTSKIYCIYNNDDENPYDYTAHQYIGTEWTEFTVQIMDTDLGVYYIDEVEVGEYHTPGKMSVKVTAYDGFYLTERKFTPPQNDNPSIRSLIQSMASACGFSYTANDWSNSITVSSYPEDATVRTMIGYLAGLQGTCAYFARDGKLGAKWYTACAKHITRDEQYADSFVFGASSDSTGDVTIKYLESGTGDNIVVYPNNGVIGESISFENPLMDATKLQSIYTDKVSADGTNYKISYTPLSVKWRGNATIETGEIITVESSFYSTEQQKYVDNVCYIMERTMTYDGGFSEEYKCYGENEQTISFSTNVTMQKLERKLTNMEQAIEDATSVISQTEGSVFELISANDPTDPTKNSGWLLYSTDPFKRNVIKADANGIGFSSNGGESFNAVGIWIDSQGVGHILANDIVAGQVSTDKLIVGTSTDPTTLSALVNSTKQTADTAYNTQVIPEFWSSGSNTTATHFCIPGQNSTSTVSTVNSSFRIRQGSTILVHMTTSSQGGTSTGQKYLRVCYNQYGHGSGYTGGSYPCTDVYKTDGTLYGSLPSASQTITTIDLPIYYNGKPLLKNSPDLWAANTDVAFTWEGSHWTMSYSIPTTQTEGQSILAKEAQENFITNYGVCVTSESTTAKTVSISSVTSLSVGTTIAVLFKYGNTASAPTLNVSGTGAKLMKQSDGSSAFTNWGQGSVQYFMYSGTYWVETTSYTDAMKIVGYCMNTNTTFVDGGNIYARSISAGSIVTGTLTAKEIGVGAITTDRLDIGHGYRQEMFVNCNMDDGVRMWSPTACYLYTNGSGVIQAISYNTTTDPRVYARVGQFVSLRNGSYYQITARIKPINASVFDNPFIGFYTGYGTSTGVMTSWGTTSQFATINSSTIANGSYTEILGTFKWNNPDGVYEVGVGWQGLKNSDGYYCTMDFDWISLCELSYSTNMSFKTSRAAWLKPDYQDGRIIDDYSDPTLYQKAISLTVDSGGNLTTLGYIDAPRAKVGNLSCSSVYTVGDSLTRYLTDQYHYAKTTFALITPEGEISNSSTDIWDIAQECCAHIKLAEKDGTQSYTGEMNWESTELGVILAPIGLMVVSGSQLTTITSNEVRSPHITPTSTEKIKKSVKESNSVLTEIKKSKIYDYQFTWDDEKATRKLGFIVEKETPKSLISDDGEGINLYSMASMNWKATQELIEKIEKLEAIVNDGNATK